MKIKVYKPLLMNISTTLARSIQSWLSIITTVFLKKEQAGDFEKPRFTGTGEGIDRRTRLVCNDTIRTELNNHLADDVSQRDASFSIIPTPVNHNHKPLTMKKFLRTSGVFALVLLIANLFIVGSTLGQVTQA